LLANNCTNDSNRQVKNRVFLIERFSFVKFIDSAIEPELGSG
jgi:hypothetical protein